MGRIWGESQGPLVLGIWGESAPRGMPSQALVEHLKFRREGTSDRHVRVTHPRSPPSTSYWQLSVCGARDWGSVRSGFTGGWDQSAARDKGQGHPR